MNEDNTVCGEGRQWSGCRNTGAERFGARLAEGWTEWFETPCRCCGRIFQGDTLNGLEVKWKGDEPRPPSPPPAFEEIVRDAEAYAGSLYQEAIERGAPLTFGDIVARAHNYAQERYQAAVEAAAIPEITVTRARGMVMKSERTYVRCHNTLPDEADEADEAARLQPTRPKRLHLDLRADEVQVLRNALETHRSTLMDLANQTSRNQEARDAYHAAFEDAGKLLARLRDG